MSNADKLEAIQAKIKKLKAMSKMVGNEAENAKRIINNLVKKYELEGIDADDVLDTRKVYHIRVHRLKKYALRLAKFCKVPYQHIYGKADHIRVELNTMEYKMYYELYDELKHIFNTKERELLKTSKSQGYPLKWKNDALKSFMLGYMTSNFPVQANLCPVCYEGTIVNMKCDNCGTRFGKTSYQGFNKHADQYSQGISTNTKKLSASKLRLR